MALLAAFVACYCAVVAALNIAQVVLGRPVIRRPRSRRSPAQLRSESLAAAVAMSAGSFGGLAIWLSWPVQYALGAGIVMFAAMASIYVRRGRGW